MVSVRILPLFIVFNYIISHTKYFFVSDSHPQLAAVLLKSKLPVSSLFSRNMSILTWETSVLFLKMSVLSWEMRVSSQENHWSSNFGINNKRSLISLPNEMTMKQHSSQNAVMTKLETSAEFLIVHNSLSTKNVVGPSFT